MESLATRTTCTLKGTPSGNGAATSKIEQAVVSLQEQRDRLAEEVTDLLKITDKVSTAISQIKNPVEKRILKYRYLCFFSWKQIALLMKTSLRQIYRLHSQALENFFVFGFIVCDYKAIVNFAISPDEVDFYMRKLTLEFGIIMLVEIMAQIVAKYCYLDVCPDILEQT